MHLAASEGVRHIVTELIDSGGDVNAKDRWQGKPHEVEPLPHFPARVLLLTASV